LNPKSNNDFEWILIPNQVDQYQNLIVDENGEPVYGLDPESGFPLDPFGKPFTDALYEKRPVYKQELKSSSGEAERRMQRTELVQVLAPNQVDDYGVEIVDSNYNPIYGMDDSNGYALDSSGRAFKKTRWIEIEIQTEIDTEKFNAILLIDISRSMMARDLEVKNIENEIRGIKLTMKSKRIHDFLDQFRNGIYVPRRLGAALAALTFLSEKISRSYGEKVAVIRFADISETLDFDGSSFMVSANYAQEMLERMAVSIVENVGLAYGQATNIGGALYMAEQLIVLMQDMEGGPITARPIMLILLTDGYPTDGEQFTTAVDRISQFPNVIMHVLGIGSSNKELMEWAAKKCGGEFLSPDNVGEILSWYTARARCFK